MPLFLCQLNHGLNEASSSSSETIMHQLLHRANETGESFFRMNPDNYTAPNVLTPGIDMGPFQETAKPCAQPSIAALGRTLPSGHH